MALTVSAPSLQTVEAPHKVTYAEYRVMPEDGKRYELVEGVLREMPSPSILHQKILGKLFSRLDGYVTERQLGNVFFAPLDVHLSPDLNYQPDILFVAKDGRAKITEKDIEGPPDLVVEIVSHGSRRTDKVEKHTNYAKYGVREYWLVYPDSTLIEVFNLKEMAFELVGRYFEGEAVKSLVLAGFELQTTALFD